VDRAKLRRDLDHYGPLLVGWRWLGDAAERFLGLRLFAIVRSELATVTGPDLAEGTTATKLAPEQVRALAGVPDLDLAPAFVEDAIARGDTCWAAWRDGKVVGYTWRATNGLTPHDDGAVPRAQPSVVVSFARSWGACPSPGLRRSHSRPQGTPRRRGRWRVAAASGRECARDLRLPTCVNPTSRFCKGSHWRLAGMGGTLLV
jgi:hypothetical protein